jgi:PilZ domain
LSLVRQTIGTVVQLHSQSSALAKIEGDARAALRRRVLKAGVVAYNDRHVSLPCAVRDLSATGARVRVEGSVSAPDTFELIIDIDGFEANCQVVWRKGNEIGVHFLGAPRMVAPKRAQVINPMLPTPKASLRRKPKPGEPI